MLFGRLWGRYAYVRMKRLLASLAWLGLSGMVCAESEGPSSAARPYNLDITAPVQVAGSDAAALAFQTQVLPGMLQSVKEMLPERRGESSKHWAATSLDPAKLVMAFDATARVYFLGESSGYKNTLGISTTGGSPLSPDAALIFPNAGRSTDSSDRESLVRSSNEALVPGDFVNLGDFKAGTAVDFFLIANGAAGGKSFYSTNQSLNKDGLVHAVSYAANGSAYLIIGFEDWNGGGDKDYNDFVFAVEIGKIGGNQGSGFAAPEPSLASGALVAVVLLLGFARRRL